MRDSSQLASKRISKLKIDFYCLQCTAGANIPVIPHRIMYGFLYNINKNDFGFLYASSTPISPRCREDSTAQFNLQARSSQENGTSKYPAKSLQNGQTIPSLKHIVSACPVVLLRLYSKRHSSFWRSKLNNALSYSS